MTTVNFQCTSLLLLKLLGFKVSKKIQGYKEMKGHML